MNGHEAGKLSLLLSGIGHGGHQAGALGSALHVGGGKVLIRLLVQARGAQGAAGVCRRVPVGDIGKSSVFRLFHADSSCFRDAISMRRKTLFYARTALQGIEWTVFPLIAAERPLAKMHDCWYTVIGQRKSE